MANLNGAVFAELDLEMASVLDGISPMSLTNSFNPENITSNFDQALGVIAPRVDGMSLG